MQSWRTTISRAGWFVADLFLPDWCVGCGQYGVPFCRQCHDRASEAEPFLDPDMLARFAYSHPTIERATIALKHHSRWALAEPLGESLAEVVLAALGERWSGASAGPFLVVPIPLSRLRRMHRGYNQAELLGRALVARVGGSLTLRTDVLMKVRETPSQVTLDHREKRLANLLGAFVSTPAVAGRDILVIDDVSTTGATFAEARRALLAAGARSVLCAAVAH